MIDMDAASAQFTQDPKRTRQELKERMSPMSLGDVTNVPDKLV